MADFDERLARLSPEKRALLLQQLGRQSAAPQRQEIVARQRPARLPLSFAQQRLWILDRLDPGSAVYNVPVATWMRGQLDDALLERALAEILRRHESLRTVIASDESGPCQRILAPAALNIERVDVGALPVGERRAAALDAARREAALPFDLAQGPMLRALLVRLSAEQHLFVLNAHHIAVDGWSLGLMFKELAQIYEALHGGRASPLPEPRLQYADYALWQRDHLSGTVLETQLGYWKERLQAPLPVLELPGDRARPAVQSYRGAVVRAMVPADVYGAVKELSRREGVTPFMTVLAAFDTLLLRYAGASDVVVGVGVANRNRQELESLVGFFVNTLALRVDLSGDPSFRDLLKRVRDVTLGAYSHQDLPIERLLEDLHLERNLSHSPLFQAMLFFQNFPAEDVELPGLTLSPIDFDAINPGTARSELALFANERDGGLALFLEYASDLFDAATIEAFAQHFVTLLRSATQDPGARLSTLEIISDGERHKLLRGWNDTARELPARAAVHALIEAQASRTPDAIALEHDGRRFSYRALERLAEGVARTLHSRGVRHGDLVGLFLERSPEMLAALLGVLKAGAAYVPMDPGFPPQRLAYMVEDAAMQHIITSRQLQAQLPESLAQTVLVEHCPAVSDDLHHDGGASGEDLAYVIFTSGSTGRPKGVQIPHRAVANFLATMAQEPGLTADDALCAVTTLSFDIAVLELLLPLTVGARVVLADRHTAADGAALARLLESARCTVMQATPATWRMLLESGWQGRDDLRVLCGGEALPRDLAERLLGCTGEVWNVYGPTETTVWSTLERVRNESGPVSIGHAIGNTEVYVVDAAFQLVPVGVPGELVIGGLGVARGYLARPELTAEKFVPDPFGARPGARLYRTGDVARWRRDGRLEVVGRIDDQVKLRGYRIELGEIESVLRAQVQVAQAVVACREDRPGDKRLVAYLVPTAGESPDAETLRAFVRQRLPDYMVPSAWVTLAQLPLTPNGKVDRRALPAPEASAEIRAYQPPRTAEETTLAGLWAEVLGLERVGIHDDFFDLGGHSLLATQLVARVEKAFGGQVALRSLFEAPTVAGFAELLLRDRMAAVDAGALSGMLDQLEGLSDAEIEALLANAG